MNRTYYKLGKNIALLTLGNFTSKILSFLLVPLYTAVLTTAEYGISDVLTSSVNIILPFFSLLIYEAVLRFALDNGNDKRQIFSAGFYITVVGCLVVACLSQVLHVFDVSTEFIWLLVLYYISLAFYNLILQFTKGVERVGIYSIAGIINTFVFIVCNIVFLLWLDWGVKGYLLAFIIGHFISAVYAFCFAKVYKYFVWCAEISIDFIKKMIRYSGPMIPNSISWWINSSSDKYMLMLLWGVEEIGIYSVAYKIPSILAIIIGIFISAWQLSAVEDFGSETSKKMYADIYDKYEGLLYILSAILIGCTPILAKFLFSNDFYIAWKYAPVLILASVFNSLAAFFGSVYTSAKKTNMLMISTMIGAIGNIALNCILIPPFGAMGAAVATLVSYTLIWFIRLINSRQLLPFAIKFKRNFMIYIILSVEALLVSLDYDSYFIISMSSILLVCFSCRKVISDVIDIIISKAKAK